MKFTRAYLALMYLVLVLDVVSVIAMVAIGNYWVAAVVTGSAVFLGLGIAAVHSIRRTY